MVDMDQLKSSPEIHGPPVDNIRVLEVGWGWPSAMQPMVATHTVNRGRY